MVQNQKKSLKTRQNKCQKMKTQNKLATALIMHHWTELKRTDRAVNNVTTRTVSIFGHHNHVSPSYRLSGYSSSPHFYLVFLSATFIDFFQKDEKIDHEKIFERNIPAVAEEEKRADQVESGAEIEARDNDRTNSTLIDGKAPDAQNLSIFADLPWGKLVGILMSFDFSDRSRVQK